jgi:adenylate cyclase
VAHNSRQREDGFALLAAARTAALREQFTRIAATMVDTHLATEKARTGDLDGAVELSRSALKYDSASGDKIFGGRVTSVLVEALLRRGADTDLSEAQVAIDRLEAMVTEPGFVMHEIWLLRMRDLMDRERGDTVSYLDRRDRYRARARSLGFEWHISMAEAMTSVLPA